MSLLFPRSRWILETKLAKEECVRRLKSKLRGMWETRWNAEKPLHGTVSSSGFAVLITPSFRRGGANPYFIRGVFISSAAGTTIRAKYGVLPTVRLFVAGMVSFLLFMAWRVLRPSNALELFIAFGILSSIMVLATYGVVRNLIRWAEWDRELILGAVVEILEARIIEPPEAALAGDDRGRI